MKIKHRFISIAIASALSIAGVSQAAPLPDGTLLTIEPGSGSGVNNPCPGGGSCFGLEAGPGFIIWTDIGPGTDGGIVIGKNQVSGGQEAGFSPSDDPAYGTPGEMTAAFDLFVQFGTFATTSFVGLNPNANSDASANIFDDTSCSGAGCIGITELGTWNLARSTVVPFGSSSGCLSLACTVDELNGIFVSNWTVNSDQTYSMDYSQVAPDHDPSNWGNFRIFLHLEGNITQFLLPEVSGIWQGTDPQFLLIFGKNFGAFPQVRVNGIDAMSGGGDDTIKIVALPDGVTPPFTVEVTTPDGVGSFPKACPAL